MCALAPKKPLVVFACLMHLRIALLRLVFGRTGCVDNRRVNDGSRRDPDAATGQIAVHRIQHLAAQVVLLKQVPKVQDRRLIRCRRAAQIDASKAPQHGRFVQCVLDRRSSESFCVNAISLAKKVSMLAAPELYSSIIR